MEANEFPSNSKLPKSPEREREKINPVVIGEATSRKKSLGARFREMFIGGDSGSVLEYVVKDVLVPQAKDMFTEAITQSVERLIYGESRSSSRSRYGSRPSGQSGYTPYNRIAERGNNPVGRADRDPRRPVNAQIRPRSVDEIILQTRPEADHVLGRMYDLLEKYDVVTVADLHDLLDWSSNHVDQKWGWTDLEGSTVRRIRGGYSLVLPNVESLG